MDRYFRSQRLLDRNRSALIVVDVQASLTPLVQQSQRVVWNIGRLARVASELQVVVHATEQYPQGLKATVPELAPLLPPRHEKLDFSVCGVTSLNEQLTAAEKSQLVVVGIETHICVLQSAMDLQAMGFDVFVVTDAVSARGTEDHTVGLERMRDEGIQLLTTEGAIFEWCKTAADSAFKKISAIVREPAPNE